MTDTPSPEEYARLTLIVDDQETHSLSGYMSIPVDHADALMSALRIASNATEEKIEAALERFWLDGHILTHTRLEGSASPAPCSPYSREALDGRCF